MEKPTYNITMRRGDSESLTISTSSALFTSGDTLYFTVRKDVYSPIALQKTVTSMSSSSAVISIYPDDTKDLDFGIYLYDIQLTKGTGEVITIVPGDPAASLPKFKLMQEVTY